MQAEIIIHQANALGIRLYVEAGKLRYIAKANQFPAHLKEAIKTNKAEIMAYLLAQETSHHFVIQPVEQRERMPLSFAQHRILFIDAMYQGSAHYNMLSTLDIQGDVCLSSLRDSFQTLIERHAILRTRYVEQRGQWYQQIVPADAQKSIHQYDLSSLSAEQRASRFAQESNHLFDLQTENPIRVSVFKVTPQLCRLFFNVHHIACDGVSLTVLVAEFQQLYQAALKQQVAVLPQQTLQYHDFCIWQQQHFDDGGFDKGLQFWQQTLVGAPLVHQLPLKGVRPQTQHFRGRSRRVAIEGEQLVRLRQFNQTHQGTLYMTLQTVFALLLCRFSRSDEVVIGTPVAGRDYAELESIVGLFLNNIVVRTQVAATDSFDSLFRRNKETILQAYEHQDVPFDLVVEQVNPVRDSGIAPVFQILFNLIRQNTTLAIGDTAISNSQDEQTTVKSDLELVAIDKTSLISLTWLYDADLFSENFIATMAASFLRLLDAVMAQPQTKVYDFSLLDPELPLDVAATAGADFIVRPAQTVTELLAAAVQPDPAKMALGCGDWQLSQAALLVRIDCFAALLQAEGFERGDRIGLYLEREPLTVILMLAMLKLGLTYVPLATNLPQQRLSYIIDDAQLTAVLVNSTIDLPPTHPVSGLALSVADWLQREVTATTSIAINHSPSDIAYVMYTSGTSGKPKGVQVSQANLTSLLVAIHTDLSLDADRVWLSMTNLSFDISMLELLGSVCFGMALVFPVGVTSSQGSSDVASDVVSGVVSGVASGVASAEAVAAAVSQHQVTTMQCTPSLFSSLLLDPAFVKVLPTLNTVLLGGEPLSSHIVSYWQQHQATLAQVRLFNMYGPTETTIWSTFALISSPLSSSLSASPCLPEGTQQRPITIGRALSNGWVRIVDQQMRPVPAGVIGELAIGGAGVSQGYLNQAALSQEKFVDDPHQPAHQPAHQLYLTGDLVRLLDCGELDFIGRSDEQVKIRGHRIELAETEAALEQCAGIDKATVLLRPSAAGENQLVAFVLSHGNEVLAQAVEAGSVIDEVLVAQALQHWLPDYMIPTTVVSLDSLPLTPNGKVDKAALRLLTIESGNSKTLPDTPMEQTLALFWKEVLKNQSVEVFKETDFFNLGGNSLHLMQLSSMIKDEMAMSVPLTLFIDNRSLQQLSVAVQDYFKQAKTDNEFAPTTVGELGQFAIDSDVHEIEI